MTRAGWRLLAGGDNRLRRGSTRAGTALLTADDQQPKPSRSCRAAESRVLSSSRDERLARVLAKALLAQYRASGDSDESDAGHAK